VGAADVSVRITVTVRAQIESGYMGEDFVRAELSKLILPEVTKRAELGLTASESLQAALNGLSVDAVREAQSQALALGELMHRTAPPTEGV
jgi:hypothetical protein